MATHNCRYVGDVLFHQPTDPILCAMVFDPGHPTIINGFPQEDEGPIPSFEGPYLSGKYG